MDLSTIALPALAEMANEATSQFMNSLQRTVTSAVIAGRALQAAKDQLEHGEWGDWLDQNFSQSKETARRMMRVAKRAGLTDLGSIESYTQCLQLIADERAAERAAANPEPAWQEPADMPPPEPPAGPRTIVDHKATAGPRAAIDRITNRNTDGDKGLPDDVIADAFSQLPTGRQQAPQKPVQAAQQPAEPIEPEVVQAVLVRAPGWQQELFVGRIYRFTREGFERVDE